MFKKLRGLGSLSKKTARIIKVLFNGLGSLIYCNCLSKSNIKLVTSAVLVLYLLEYFEKQLQHS